MARYYLYISDAKVDMLLGSMAERVRKKLAIRLNVNLKVLSVTLSHEADLGPREHRVARLDAVLEHLRETEHVGTLASPGSYVEDTLAMAYAVYPAEHVPPSETHMVGAATVFTGVLEDRCLVMVGSSAHLIGQAKSLQSVAASSDLPTIVRVLDGLAALHGAAREPEEPAARRVARDGYMCASEILRECPSARCAFMAKKLFSSTLDPKHPHAPTGLLANMGVLVASPLYVALE